MELLIGLACAALILIPLMLLQAMVLRFACTLCGVEPPDYVPAIVILIIGGVVSVLINVAIIMVFIGGRIGGQVTAQELGVPILIAMPVSFVVTAGIYSMMLGTTLGKAFLILIMNHVLYFLLCGLPSMILKGVGQMPMK